MVSVFGGTVRISILLWTRIASDFVRYSTRSAFFGQAGFSRSPLPFQPSPLRQARSPRTTTKRGISLRTPTGVRSRESGVGDGSQESGVRDDRRLMTEADAEVCPY